jgi:hypothetical protein
MKHIGMEGLLQEAFATVVHATAFKFLDSEAPKLEGDSDKVTGTSASGSSA